VADHFQYLASLGLIVLFTAAASVGLRRASRSAVCAVAVTVLGCLTWDRAHAFSDAQTLWTDTIAKNPDRKSVV